MSSGFHFLDPETGKVEVLMSLGMTSEALGGWKIEVLMSLSLMS